MGSIAQRRPLPRVVDLSAKATESPCRPLLPVVRNQQDHRHAVPPNPIDPPEYLSFTLVADKALKDLSHEVRRKWIVSISAPGLPLARWRT